VKREGLPVKQVRIGHISGAAGLRGEVRFYHDSGDAEQLVRLVADRIPVSLTPAQKKAPAKAPSGAHTPLKAPVPAAAPFFVENIRYSGRVPILKLPGVDDRNAAEALIGFEVFAPEDRLRPVEPDAYLVSDLIGLQVLAGDPANEEGADAGTVIGSVTAVIDNPAHDILEIETPDGQRVLLPMVDAYILNVDLSARRLRVRPPGGLLE